jgi:hypothetical protein
LTEPQFYDNPARTVYVRRPGEAEFTFVGIGPMSRCPFHLWPAGSIFRTDQPLMTGLEFWIDPRMGPGAGIMQFPST